MYGYDDAIAKLAEWYFEMAYKCDNVYSVELISAETGEMMHQKCKG